MRPFSAALLLLAAIAASPAQAQDPAETAPEVEPEVEPQAVPAQARAEPLLLVTVNVPGASIVVDESPAIPAPASALRVPPGDHMIQVSAEGYGVFEQSVRVPAEGARVDVFLTPSEALTARMVANEDHYESSGSGVHKKWWFWAAIGGGVVVVAGVIAAIALASGGDDGQAVIPVPPIPGGP